MENRLSFHGRGSNTNVRSDLLSRDPYWFAALSRLRRYVLFISTIAVPTILGALTAVGGWSPDLKASVAPIQITVLFFAFALGWGLFWFDEHAALVFQKFAHETQKNSDLQNEIERQRVELGQRFHDLNHIRLPRRAYMTKCG